MSFRELRDFTEHMRVLGYPRLVSVDNFRTPNFGLVADILFWMVHRYDPSASLSDDISTEDYRVEFLQSVAQLMWTKAGVKLNTKRLYSADGKAVKELLKVANLLYAAHRANRNILNADGPAGETDGKTQDEGDMDPAYGQLHARLPDVKATRKLASQITESGAKLFDLLQDERELAGERQKCLRFLESISNNLDSGSEQKFVEKKVEELLMEAKENVRALEKQCEDLASDEKTLQVKIKKKQAELERNDKRLKSLQSVRPAFMDEYEKLEAELERQYEVYLEKFRNLDYLEHRLELFNQKEREKLEESERARKRIQMSVMEKKARDLRGDDDDDHILDDDDDEEPRSADRESPSDNRRGNDSRRTPQRDNNSSARNSAQRGGNRRVALSDDESEISAESEDSNANSDDLSDESSASGSISGDDDDLIDDDDDDGSDLSDASEDDDVHGHNASHSDASDESDDNF